MSDMKSRAISVLYYVSAIYDGVLGLAFLAFPLRLLDAVGVPGPNHPGYIQFPAALLVVFALMFLSIAGDPERNRNLMPYGILLKVCYCGVVFWYWYLDRVSFIWKPFAVADLIFGILFLWAYSAITKAASVGS